MKSIIYITITLLFLVVSCQNKNKVDEIENNDKPSDKKSEKIKTIEPDILKEVLPDSLYNYELAPFSEFSSQESDRTIHTAKYQFAFEREEEKSSVIIDITDYGNLDLVPFPDIYDEPPLEVNVVTDTLKTDYYKGYSIWSPVDNTGRSNIIVNDRFVIKVRSSANDTISDFLKSILDKIDYNKLKQIEDQNKE